MTGTQATVAAQAGERPRSRGAAALALILTMLVAFTGQLISTTAASAGQYVYDTRHVARVDGRIAGLATEVATQISAVREFASPPAEPSGGPTTPAVLTTTPRGIARIGGHSAPQTT